MTEKSMAKADFVTSVVLLAFSIAVIVLSAQMPTVADAHQSKFSAPGLVPAFIGAMLCVLSLSLLLRSIKRQGMKNLVPPGAVKALVSQETTSRILKTLVICVVYIFFLGKIWFPVPTFLFIFAFIFFFEYDFKAPFAGQRKKLVSAVIIALVSTVLITLVFQKLFLVNLP